MLRIPRDVVVGMAKAPSASFARRFGWWALRLAAERSLSLWLGDPRHVNESGPSSQTAKHRRAREWPCRRLTNAIHQLRDL